MVGVAMHRIDKTTACAKETCCKAMYAGESSSPLELDHEWREREREKVEGMRS